MNRHGVGKQVIGAAGVMFVSRRKHDCRVKNLADRECSLFTSGGLHAFLATR